METAFQVYRRYHREVEVRNEDGSPKYENGRYVYEPEEGFTFDFVGIFEAPYASEAAKQACEKLGLSEGDHDFLATELTGFIVEVRTTVAATYA